MKEGHGEGRIFFNAIGDLVQASGFFPIEVNVPDTVSGMMQGIQGMWSSMMNYLGYGEQPGSDTYFDPVDEVIKADKKTKRKTKKSRKDKKDKKTKKKPKNDNSLFILF